MKKFSVKIDNLELRSCSSDDDILSLPLNDGVQWIHNTAALLYHTPCGEGVLIAVWTRKSEDMVFDNIQFCGSRPFDLIKQCEITQDLFFYMLELGQQYVRHELEGNIIADGNK